MPRDLPTGTVTFFFSDIESSTTILQSLGVDYVGLLEAQQAIIRRSLEHHGGLELGTEGDSFFAVFASADAAVSAAVAAQRELQAHDWPAGHIVRVRMGLHTGDGALGGDDYVGLDVHRAARIAAAAHGGQILVSDATRRLTERGIDDGIAFVDLGEHRLKDLTRPERLHQLTVAGLTDVFPPPRSLSASARNLPTTLTTFVGRGPELDAIEELVGGARVVTLAGPGGIGKTRLAVEIARRQVAGFADGVVFVPLAHLSGGDPVIVEVAAGLGLHERADRTIDSTVTEYLARRAVLIVLDNCEHLRDAVSGFVERLIDASPESKVLATSREPLAVEGEVVYRVEPLPIPEGQPTSAKAMLQLEVVSLFADRARAASVAFDAADHVDDILEICRRLDGIPLAIELAAARTTTLAPAQILERLDESFGLAAQGRRARISPHETLDAAIDWSHGLLSDAEARLFRRVAVFEGGFDADAAEAICSDESLPRAAVVATLDGLITKSLVNTTIVGRRARYGVYEPIRRYARSRLLESGEQDEWIGRHESYFLEWARSRAAELRTDAQLDALDELETNHRNLLAVLTRAWERGDRVMALDMAATLIWFWYLHAHLSEGELWADRLLTDGDSPSGRSRIRMMIGAAEFDYRLGRHDRAEHRLAGALAEARAMGSRSLEMWALSHRATNELFKLSLETAGEYARASLAIAEELGAIAAAAYAQYLLIGIEAERLLTAGNLTPVEAERLHADLEPLAAASRGLGDRNMVGHLLQVAGFLSGAAQHPRAWAELDDALTAFGELRNAGCSAHCLEMTALVLSESHPPESASLLAAADSVRAAAGVEAPPLEEAASDLARDAIRTALDTDALARAESKGADSTLAEAVALGRAILAGVGSAERADA